MSPVLVKLIANQGINCLIAPGLCLNPGTTEIANCLVQSAGKLNCILRANWIPTGMSSVRH